MFYSKKIVIKVVFGDDVPVLNGVWSFSSIYPLKFISFSSIYVLSNFPFPFLRVRVEFRTQILWSDLQHHILH